MILAYIGALLGGLGIGISITNMIWSKYVRQSNHEWYEMLSEMQEDFYKKLWGQK